ncbi:MOSC domain-containing protein [Sansalvadorimonas verongulae]|uniref:MOSC domain-containing protein n=1 Tax=Sansalvadorimonas verongulae TaxID=2172824 RepID=UPI0012BD43BB|nr:MOSC N-terminal beta barrel domain-containing protein [Sansalvadorimonas verongulae]MTI14357.1 MOSC domain-containing protein [Sansalvadorimonas verongulae]
MLIVSELAVYPVKSCRQLTATNWTVDSFGLTGDRRWMVIDSNTGLFVSQRTHPQMVKIVCVPTVSGLVLRHPEQGELAVSRPDQGGVCSATVWSDTCGARDAGDNAAQWCSEVIGKSCRLVFMPDTSFRQVDRRYAKEGIRASFADGFPFLLISEASLELLNTKLAENGEDSVPMKRFRPNIVVKGCEPHAEDQWNRIRIGGIEFSGVKDCTRCVMTTVNTDTAEKNKEPLRTLAQYRRNDKGVIFGQNMIHHGTGLLSVGMQVEVLD